MVYSCSQTTFTLVLFCTISNRGINACGTVCVNRKQFPKELITIATVNNRFYDYRSSGPLLASVWVDKRSIYFVSTFHSAEAPSSAQQPFVKRRRLDGTQQDIACPPVLPDYQEFMRGVDRGDQLHTYYKIGRRSRKWWKIIFFYIVECAVLNAFILDKSVHPSEHVHVGRKKGYSFFSPRANQWFDW